MDTFDIIKIMSAAKMVLFDIDGTLLMTGGAGRIAFERGFEELFGIKAAWGNTVPDGKTDPIIIKEIADRTLKRPLQNEEYETLRERYLLYFAEEIIDSPRFRLLPGVPAILDLLSGMEHILLGIVTGNFERAAWAKLEKGGLRHYFSFGGFGSDSWDRAEITRIALERGMQNSCSPILKKNIFVIGDTQHDVLAAKKLGLKSVAVRTGHTPESEILASGPDYLLNDLASGETLLRILH